MLNLLKYLMMKIIAYSLFYLKSLTFQMTKRTMMKWKAWKINQKQRKKADNRVEQIKI